MSRTRSSRLLTATVANFLFFISVTSFFTLPVHIEALGGSRADVGRVMGAFGAVSVWAIPLAGTLADRFGRRPFLASGALLWCLTAVGFSFVRELGPLVYVLRMLQGLSFSLVFISTNALIVDFAPEGGLGRAIAIFGTATLSAHALGPSIAEAAVSLIRFEGVFYASAVVGLLALVGFLAVGESQEQQERGGAVTILSLMRRPAAIGGLVAAFGAACAFGAAIHFMSVFVRSRGMSSHAPFFVTYVLAAVGVRFTFGGLGDRVGHHRVGVFATLVFGLGVAALSGAHSALGVAAAAAIFGAGHGLSYPSLNALFVSGVPRSARARAMAVFNLAFNVGVTVAAFAAGEIAERAGYGAMWLCFGAVALLGGGVALLDRPR